MPIGLHRRSHHWRWVAALFVVDGFLVWLSVVCGIWLRFGQLSPQKLTEYAPSIAAASLVMPTIFYIAGFYSTQPVENGLIRQLRWLAFGLLGVLVSILVTGSVNFSSRIGRGVLASSMSILIVLVSVRHLLLLRRQQRRWKKILCLVSSEDDEAAAALLNHLWGKRAKYVGMITGKGYVPVSQLPVDSSLAEICRLKVAQEVDMLLVRDRHLADPHFGPSLRQLR